MSTRRNTLQALASAGVISSPGCLSYFRQGEVDLYLVNWCQDVVDVEVNITSPTGDAAFNEEYNIKPNEDVKEEGILSGGEYNIHTTLNSRIGSDYHFTMGECDDQKLVIRIDRCNSIEFESKKC